MLVTFASTKSELQGSVGEDDPRFPHYSSTFRQRETPEHQIIQGKYPTMSCYPLDESHPFRSLNFPNTLPRETRDRSTLDLIVIGPNIKLTIPIKTPMGTITPNTPKNLRLNEIKEREGSF